MLTGKTLIVALTIRVDVLHMLEPQALHGGNYLFFVSAVLAHALCGKVGMAPRAVPVSLDRLRFVIDDEPRNLGDALQNITRHPHHITLLNALARADLEFPLPRGDLCVNATDFQAGVQLCTPGGVSDLTAKGVLSANTAIVGPLGSRLAIDWKAERPARPGVDEKVLLFQAEPRGEALRVVHDLIARGAGVGGQGHAIWSVCIAQNEDVVAATEGVLVDDAGLEDDFRVLAGGLVGGGAVVVPGREVGRVCDIWVDSARLGAELVETVEPDVLGEDDRGGDREVEQPRHLAVGRSGRLHGDGEAGGAYCAGDDAEIGARGGARLEGRASGARGQGQTTRDERGERGHCGCGFGDPEGGGREQRSVIGGEVWEGKT